MFVFLQPRACFRFSHLLFFLPPAPPQPRIRKVTCMEFLVFQSLVGGRGGSEKKVRKVKPDAKALFGIWQSQNTKPLEGGAGGEICAKKSVKFECSPRNTSVRKSVPFWEGDNGTGPLPFLIPCPFSNAKAWLRLDELLKKIQSSWNATLGQLCISGWLRFPAR